MAPRRELLSPEGLRLDGRRPGELRRTDAQLGVVAHADGSALFVCGNTRVLATVHGPREARRMAGTQHDRATLAVAVHASAGASQTGLQGAARRAAGAATRPDRRMADVSASVEAVFASAVQLELYPRSLISVSVEVLESDGGVLAAAINATCLALVNAGVPLYDYVLACTCVHTGSAVLVDTNREEESAATGAAAAASLTLAAYARGDPASAVLLALADAAPGTLLGADRLLAMSDAACEAISRVHAALDECVVRPDLESLVLARAVLG